jgi:hypothetical protein
VTDGTFTNSDLIKIWATNGTMIILFEQKFRLQTIH